MYEVLPLHHRHVPLVSLCSLNERKEATEMHFHLGNSNNRVPLSHQDKKIAELFKKLFCFPELRPRDSSDVLRFVPLTPFLERNIVTVLT